MCPYSREEEVGSVSYIFEPVVLSRCSNLRDRFEHFQSLDSFEKSSYVLGSEAWGKYSSKDFVLSVVR